jgi:hypothetical protein
MRIENTNPIRNRPVFLLSCVNDLLFPILLCRRQDLTPSCITNVVFIYKAKAALGFDPCAAFFIVTVYLTTANSYASINLNSL